MLNLLPRYHNLHSGNYRNPNLLVDAYGIYTNTQFNGPYRALGCELFVYAVERNLDMAAERLGITQEILMEINIGAEESKSGVGQDDLWPLLDAAAAKTHLKVRGLMAIPPADADDTATRRFFAEMRELLAKAAARGYENARMNILSMGMSHDYAAAIAEGATIVRVGTAIYGARDYSKKK